MQLSKGKISMRQALIFVFISITSPLLRVLPSYSGISKQASWVVPIISLAILSIYILILNAITKKYKDKNLSEIFEIIFGKTFGKIVTTIFLIWAIFLLSVYLRYFAERYLSTIMRDAYIEFLLITILLVAYYIAKNNIEYLARMFEIFFVVITVLIVGTTLITFTQIRAENLLPVTTYDIVPVLKSSVYYVGLLGFMVWPFSLVTKYLEKKSLRVTHLSIYFSQQ
jgi:spore germination protein KB